MRALLIGAATLALAACGSGGDRADGEIQMQAGKWTQTMVIEKFEVPGAPPEAAAMMQAMVGQENKTDTCMTEDQVAKGWEEQAKSQMQSDECETKEFDAKGGTIKGVIACKSPGGGAANMTIDGKYSATNMDMTMTADIEDASMPGGKATMVMKMSGERVGECDTAPAAG